MPVASNGVQYNDPAVAGIASNIASMFAAPSGPDMAGYANAAATRAKAARDAALAAAAANPSITQDQLDRLGIGDQAYTPVQSFYAQSQNNATTQRGQDLQMKLGEEGLISRPITPDQSITLTPDMATRYGMPTTPITGQGALSSDQLKAIIMGNGVKSGLLTPADQKDVAMQGVEPVMTIGQSGAPQYQNPQSAVSSGAAPAVVPGSAQQAFTNAEGANQAKNYDAILQGGNQATQRLATLQQLDQASKTAGYQGIGGSSALPLRQALASFGIDTKSESDAEVLQSGGNQLALQLRNPANGGGLPGSVSDADRNFLTSMTASLDHTPAGNQKILATAMAVAQRDVDTATLAAAYVKAHGQLDGGFNAELAHFANTHPLLPNLPAGPKTQADFDALPVGMRYVDPGDGKIYVK